LIVAKKVMSDEEIVTAVLAKSKDSVGWYDSKLSVERTRVLRYYNGEYPKRQHLGASSYVSTDVYDGVEMMKAQLLEVFAGGDEIAQFDPDNDMSEQDCRIATEYAKWVIFRQNNGYQIFSDTIHDALTARIGVVKCFWDEKFEYNDEDFSQLHPHDAMGLAAQPDVDSMDATLNEATGHYSGTLTRKIDKSKISIIVVPPEEFLVSPRALSIHLAPYVAHRTLKTRAELKAMGYDSAKVALCSAEDTTQNELGPEALQRNDPVEDNFGVDSPVEPSQEQVMLYESYVRMDIGEGTKLYKICHVGSVMLDKQEIDRVPFLPYVPLPVPHMLYGNNFAARIIPVQNARTVLTRGVLDHTAITTNPRWQVVKGGLPNPKEMLENRLGGIVNVSRPDSVSALAYPTLNPFIFQVLGMLKDDKEQSTGISSLSQGLNKDAISKQNSQGLVDQLVQLSGQRQKIAARNFAYNFFVPLMIEVIRLAIQHETKQTWIEVAGATMQATPQLWTERKTCSVSMHLGYGEKEATAAKIVMAYQHLASDPALQTMFQPKNRYEMIRDAMRLQGLNGAARYITSPDKAPPPQPPQPDPVAMAKVQVDGKKADAAMMEANASLMHEQTHAAEGQVKANHADAKLHVDAMFKAQDQARKDFDVQNRVNVSQREMALAERTPQGHREAYVAPH
jgi:hypothetical protein